MVHILRSTSLWGGGGLPDTIMPTFRGGGGKKYPKMYYVVCERSLKRNVLIVGGTQFYLHEYETIGVDSI